ncbi:uncharacterized protein Hap1MRO34_010218 isoform 1-T1 [Clarias gariepinus]
MNISFFKDTDSGKDQVKKPQVSVYPVSRPQANGKRVLLCQARGMFPELVRFTWQAVDWWGRKVELKDDEQLEQRDKDREVQITSMLIVDRHKAMKNYFTCSVQHDSRFNDQIITIPRVFGLPHNLYLFSVSYVILLLKNVLYFCVVSILLCKRNRINKEISRSKAH